MEQQINAMKQPKQLYMLFFAEMWERFSFYGMRALLILFMVKEFLYSDDEAYHVYAAYGALVYTTPFLGGIIADKLLGYRKSVMLGGIRMAIGHFVMAGPDLTPEGYKWLDQYFFFTALAFLIVGNGFFKPNISSIVGSLYGENGAAGWGDSGQAAVPADYDGDGKVDPAVYWESMGIWRLWLSTYGYAEVNVLAPGGVGFKAITFSE